MSDKPPTEDDMNDALNTWLKCKCEPCEVSRHTYTMQAPVDCELYQTYKHLTRGRLE